MKYEKESLNFFTKLKYTWFLWKEELMIALPFVIISMIIWMNL